MDLVLGVSMAPHTVRMVLVEGQAAGGVIVDQDDFPVAGDAPAVAAANQLVEAILGTREGAAADGYQVTSSGVTWTDPVEEAALRDALAARKIENVVLVSAFMAAAALAQAVGSATNCARTALLFVEPDTATLAVVLSSDGSIADVRRQPLSKSDDAALAELAALVTGAVSMKARPDGVFLVGAGVDIPQIKPTLEAATSLSVTAPEEPEMALARGAALASANAHLGAPRTIAMPAVQDPENAPRALAYSAEAEEPAAEPGERRSRKSLLAFAGATAIFAGGVVALVLAIGIRPHVEQRPSISKNIVAPVTEAPPQAPGLAPPPPSAVPVPESAAPPQAPAPVDPKPQLTLSPPQQWLPLRPRDDDHDGDGWLRRHLGRGILGP